MGVVAGVIEHVQSKNKNFSKLYQPNKWVDLRMLIGIFVFYNHFLPLYYPYIRPWIYILSKQPQIGALSQNE